MEREGGSEGEEWWEKKSNTERGGREEQVRKREKRERKRKELRAVLRGKEETVQTGSKKRERERLL